MRKIDKSIVVKYDVKVWYSPTFYEFYAGINIASLSVYSIVFESLSRQQAYFLVVLIGMNIFTTFYR